MGALRNYIGEYYNDVIDAQQYDTTLIVEGFLAILVIVAAWKIFTKAGEPGWVALIPGYNLYFLFKIAMGNGWFFLLLFLPVINWFAIALLGINLARAFNKPPLYALGLVLLPPVFMCILGFSNAQYFGPGGFGDYRPDEDTRQRTVEFDDFGDYMRSTPFEANDDPWDSVDEVQTVDFEVEKDK